MAIFPCETNPNEIIEIIHSDNFNDFHLSIKQELRISNSDYSIVAENYCKEQGGYADESILASILPDSEWKCVKNVVFYTESISSYINSSFSRIYKDEIFHRAVDICVRYLLAHELTHIFQISHGYLTKEIYTNAKAIPYPKRDFEIEADVKAIEIMERYEEFAINICNMVKLRIGVDNDSVETLMNKYDL